MLQNSILDFYAHNLIEKADLERIRSIFEEIDDNGDGLLSYQEIEKVMDKMGRKQDTKKLFDMMNYKENDMVSYEDFIKAMIDRKQLDVEENIRKCFNAIDTDNNNHITIQELKNVLFFKNNTEGDKDFKETFYAYSQGKHYVILIRLAMKILRK